MKNNINECIEKTNEYFFGELVKELSFGTWKLRELEIGPKNSIVLSCIELPREVFICYSSAVLFVSERPVYCADSYGSEFGPVKLSKVLTKVTKFSSEDLKPKLLDILTKFFNYSEANINSLGD